ncbi:glycosyltransferase [Sphingobacterium rhinopitheci]|uniref:glycosyltransferase n=1 Tax=Sphingobacterium rhinopitheci TaxID=2781960 RepID=UPI001F51A77A|nr:glycosyltransferase [Sphingobacterium rhinopitheci]MCI0920751.1 glycosyltransferase [Sphingobacterium rhinopitheci]
MDKKLIVISAVNLVEAGTLAILRECLSYLSKLADHGEYKIVAVVFDKNLVDYPNIEYIETQWPKKKWINRLWYEYVSMNNISKSLNPVYLWFSLHDTSPTVKAERRAVYCHNSYFNYKWRLHDLIFAPKIALFAIFTKFIYRTNIHKNNYLVVQQDWFRQAMHTIFNVPVSKIIVARPESPLLGFMEESETVINDMYSFVFAGSPNSHKNFEIICKSVNILIKEYNISNFKVSITVKGNENKYANWLFKNWGHLENLHFTGFMPKDSLFKLYEDSNCLIFPSKIESWGLPISEYSQLNKPMLLADLPYAHETAEGARYTAFFEPTDERDLADKMRNLINGDSSFLKPIPRKSIKGPVVKSWEDLFSILLK